MRIVKTIKYELSAYNEVVLTNRKNPGISRKIMTCFSF